MVDNVQNMAKRRRSTPTYYHQWKKCLQRNTYYYCHDDCRCYYAERYGGIANVLYLPLGWVRSLVIVNIIDFALVLILNLFVIQFIINEQCLILQPMYSHHNHTPLIRVLCYSPSLPTKALISTCIRVLHCCTYI